VKVKVLKKVKFGFFFSKCWMKGDILIDGWF